METLYRVQQALGFYETQFPDVPIDKPCVYLMALAERLPTAELESFRDRYPFSQETREALSTYRSLTWHALRELGSQGCSAGCAFKTLLGKPVPWVLYLMAKVQPTSRQALVRDFLVRDRFVKLGISGDDLIKAGVPPSAVISRALLETKAAKVEGGVRTREEELAFALEQVGKKE
jgi:tRNA nucleotidyltransferase (CCA-adding enzyme)